MWDERVATAQKENRVSRMGVPELTNPKGNDRVDELLKQGADMHFFGPELFLGVSERQLKKELQDRKAKEMTFL